MLIIWSLKVFLKEIINSVVCILQHSINIMLYDIFKVILAQNDDSPWKLNSTLYSWHFTNHEKKIRWTLKEKEDISKLTIAKKRY